MLKTYNELVKEHGTNYQIQRLLAAGMLYRLEKGIYSDSTGASALALLMKRHPKAVVTLESAFYYHSLTDEIPDVYSLATDKHAYLIQDRRVKQYYVDSRIFGIGITTMERSGTTFRIYDRERMLIELIRYKKKLPYDLYKEVVRNYRDLVYDLDIARLQKYITLFPKGAKIIEAIETEVF